MTTKDTVINVFGKIMPGVQVENLTDIIEGGYMNSFELMELIMALGEEFGVEIDLDDMTPENFNSVDAVAALVERIKGN